jgi:hypothetical protein
MTAGAPNLADEPARVDSGVGLIDGLDANLDTVTEHLAS